MSDRSNLSATEIQAIFDRIAPAYDRLNDALSLGQHRIWKKMALKWCQPTENETALDLCCGSGDLAQLLAREVGREGKVFGVDFSAEQLAIACQRTSHYLNLAPIEWVEGDALDLPFAEGTFDCATMGYGLRNVTDIPRCLQELHRVLKSGAKVAILDFHRPSSAFTRSFQQWYLQNIVVPTAKNWGLTDEYAYIVPSLERFPDGSQQVQLAYQVGFTSAVHYRLVGGMMGVLVATK